MRRRLKTSEVSIVKKQIYDRQRGVCPICDTRMLKLADACLDHDHDTGLIRGVLCRNCNGIEGRIKNLVRRARRGLPPATYLGKLILYWLKHQTDQTGLYHPTHKTEDEKRLARNAKARARRAAKKR